MRGGLDQSGQSVLGNLKLASGESKRICLSSACLTIFAVKSVEVKVAVSSHAMINRVPICNCSQPGTRIFGKWVEVEPIYSER